MGKPGLLLPAFDVDRPDDAGLGKLFDVRGRRARRHPEVVGKVRCRGNTQCAGCFGKQVPERICFRKPGQIVVRREHSRRQVVDPLVARQPVVDAESSVTKVHLEGVARQRAMPVTRFAFQRQRILERTCRQWPLQRDAIQQLVEIGVRLVQQVNGILPPRAIAGPPVRERRPVGCRHDARLVRPVLGVFTLAVDEVAETRNVVRTEARPQHEEMRGDKDVDEIELENPDAVHDAPEMPAIGRPARARTIEAGGSHRNTPRLGL